MHTGSCLCGHVTFQIEGDLAAPDACHCRACRKHSGHYFVSTDVKKAGIRIMGEDRLTWFASSDKVRRGFCATCGSSLFWAPQNRDWLGVAMGAFDGPTMTRTHVHVYVAEKGDYYDLADSVPQFDTVPADAAS
jgi:hypothetical protein